MTEAANERLAISVIDAENSLYVKVVLGIVLRNRIRFQLRDVLC